MTLFCYKYVFEDISKPSQTPHYKDPRESKDAFKRITIWNQPVHLREGEGRLKWVGSCSSDGRWRKPAVTYTFLEALWGGKKKKTPPWELGCLSPFSLLLYHRETKGQTALVYWELEAVHWKAAFARCIFYFDISRFETLRNLRVRPWEPLIS